MTGFLVTYGPQSTIEHVRCGKRADVTVARGRHPTSEELRHYKRTHVCGAVDGPWDLPDDEAMA